MSDNDFPIPVGKSYTLPALNELLIKSITVSTDQRNTTINPHIVGTAAQLSNNECTLRWENSDQTFRDKTDNIVTFALGDIIVWKGLDALTASIDISTIDYLTHIVFNNVSLALGIYDLDLGENQKGELNISGTGTLNVLSSDGLRVKTSGVDVNNQGGDIIINNVSNVSDYGLSTAKNLKIWQSSVTTVELECDSIILSDVNNRVKDFGPIKTQLDITTSAVINGRDVANATIAEKAATWYAIMFAGKEDGTIGGLFVATVGGICDANTLNKLTDSGINFNDENVKEDDIIFQTTDNTFGYVGAVDSNTIIGCVDRNGDDLDLFPAGTESYVIVRLSPILPSGYRYADLVSFAYNDSGSDLDPYTQEGRKVGYAEQTIGTGFNQTSLTARDLSAFVPPLANYFYGMIKCKSVGAGTTSVHVATDSIPTVSKLYFFDLISVGINFKVPLEIMIKEAQTIYTKADSATQTRTHELYISGWKL
ncbi:hypothetical protein KAR91_87270 [Candidatus Pacearchaeota archaeon]|nr:hypothetical protein [Candidatus Pacearchaeota archaeon]